MKYVIQRSSGNTKYTDLFRYIANGAHYDRLCVAVAYATIGGVRILEKTLTCALPSRWEGIRKQWLVGVDWCRSDPPALARLQQLSNSAVRIPNGQALVTERACVPAETYHPKLFIFSGGDRVAVICGSGNLSANGLTRGCECGSAQVHSTIRSSAGRNGPSTLTDWFRSAWRTADDYEHLRQQYEGLCRRKAKQQALVPIEDDVPPPRPDEITGKGLSEYQIRQLRTLDHLWIEAGALGANLGRGIPGNQLDMKRFTRAFFRAPLENITPNTFIDRITLVWDGVRYDGRTLKFGDNGMDKLNVPPVGDRGAEFYRRKTLLFTRKPNGTFLFDVGDNARKERWKAQSREVVYKVGHREWGLF